MKRKLISLLLLVTLTLNMAPSAVFAENSENVIDLSEVKGDKSLLSAHISDLDNAVAVDLDDFCDEYYEITKGTGGYEMAEGTGGVDVQTYSAVPGVTSTSSYVEGEVIALAESEDEAEEIASLYGGYLKYYSYGVATIELTDKTTKEAVMEAADQSNDLPVVWPNYIEEIEEIEEMPKEPYMDESAGSYYQWFHDFIGTEYAWERGYMGQGVNVAVLDTGVRYTHLDISGNTLPGKNFYNGAKGTPFEQDPHQHGTHVAGIIGAIYGNDFKGAGIAPKAKVASYRVAGPTGSVKQDDAMRGINAIIEDGSFKIINISIGGYSYNGLYAKVCKDAYDKGIVIFASGGNDGISSGHFPSSYEGVVCIGAVSRNGRATSFSNYGPEVDFGFPGDSISSLSNKSDVDYRVASGSSMASPNAAGTAALILSAYPELINDRTSESVDKLIQIMKDGAVECEDGEMGAGTTYLPKAFLAKVAPSAPDIRVVRADNKPVSNDLSEKTSFNAGSIDVEISMDWFYDAQIYYTLNGKMPNLNDDASIEKSGTMLLETNTRANKISGNIIIEKDGKKKKTLKVVAVNKTTGEMSDVKTVVYEFNAYPNEITIDSVNGTDTVLAGKTIKLVTDILPIKSIVRNAKWSSDNENISVSKTGVVKVNRNTAPGKYKISYTCEGYDGTADFILNVIDKSYINKIKAKSSNLKIKVSENNCSVGSASRYFTVDGGDAAIGELRYYSTNKKTISVNKYTGDVVVLDKGSAKIYAVANDGSGKKAYINVKAERLVNRIETISQNVLAVGKTIKIKPNVYPENATNKKVKLEYVGKVKEASKMLKGTGDYVDLSKISENDIEAGSEGMFKINGMSIKARSNVAGIHIFRAIPKDGGDGMESASTFAVNVKNGAITKISATKEDKNVKLFTSSYIYNRSEVNEKNNGKLKLNPLIEGRAGFDPHALEYKSSNKRVVTVDNAGEMYVNGVGKAKITCTTTDGSNKKLIYTINVGIPASSLSIEPSEYCYHTGGVASKNVFKAGSEIKFTTTLGRAYGKPTDNSIYYSSDSKFVKINKKGIAKISRTCPTNTSVTITAVSAFDEELKSTYIVKIGDIASKSGISAVEIVSNGTTRKVFMALKDKDKTSPDEAEPISTCKYEVSGDGKPYISGYEQDITGIKGYIPFVSEVTTSYIYGGENGWLSSYEKVKENNTKLNEFYANTGKKVRIIARRTDSSGEIYYKEFWCFRVKQSYDPEDALYYRDKTLYVPVK